MCGVCLLTHRCRLLWQQMLIEPLYKLQDNRPAAERIKQHEYKDNTIQTFIVFKEKICEKCRVTYIDFCSIQSILINHPEK